MQALVGCTQQVGSVTGKGSSCDGSRTAPPRSAAVPLTSTTSPAAFMVLRNGEKPEYEPILAHARVRQRTVEARAKFEEFLKENPCQCKAWVSYAMMEKRSTAHLSPEAQHKACRAVLQRGLQLNPTSTCIIQAFGLLELRCNNSLAALMMLERCVSLDPKLKPVLNWSQIAMARQEVEERLQRRRADKAARQAQRYSSANAQAVAQ